MSNERIRAIIAELEQLAPAGEEANVKVGYADDKEVPIEATREGFLWLGIYFLRAAVVPLREGTPESNGLVDVPKGALRFMEGGYELHVDGRFERLSPIHEEPLQSTLKDKVTGMVACGTIIAVVVAVLFFAAMGVRAFFETHF